MAPTAELFEKIVKGLQEKHYYHLDESISEDAFFEILNRLGEVRRVEDVRLYASHRNLHQPEALRFHTDQAWVDIIAWRCIVPDPEGPTSLLNITKLLDHFEPREVKLLMQAIVLCPNPDNLEELTPEPLLKFNGNRYRLFFMPFRPATQLMSAEVYAAWERFVKFVETEGWSAAFGVTLKEGECLFIHNKTMFHGRPPLRSDTPRHLRRVWLKSDLVEGAEARQEFLEI